MWRVPQEPSDHPCPFPIGLPARAIESAGPRTVLDPFAGSGTTLRAAKDAGVHAVGIEKSERYCEMIVKRLPPVLYRRYEMVRKRRGSAGLLTVVNAPPA